MCNLKMFSFKLLVSATLLFNIIYFAEARNATECYPKFLFDDPDRLVCVCNSNYCGFLDTISPTSSGQSVVYQTSKAGKRFYETQLNLDSTTQASIDISIDTSKKYQTIAGFGGAFADSFGYNLKKLPQNLARQAMLSYFGDQGSRYTIGRVPIGCTDQSTHFYTYDDTDDNQYDLGLKNWALQYADYNYKVPYILEAKQLNEARNSELNLFASIWSPPTWMKEKNSENQSYLKNDPKIHQAYADYYVKFFLEYRRQFGLEFFGSTVQNEAVAAMSIAPYPSLIYNGTQGSFVKDYLGPTLVKNGFTKENFDLILGDDFGSYTKNYYDLFLDPKVREFVSGYSFHYYADEDLSKTVYQSLDLLYGKFRADLKRFFMSEACKTDEQHQKIGVWSRGEDFVRDIIFDMLHNVDSWIDWTMMVNIVSGGPKLNGNPLSSPLVASDDYTEFYKLNSYYAIAHFSRFLGTNSIRLDVQPEPTKYYDSLLYIPFINEPEGLLIVVALNSNNSKESINISLKNSDTGKETSIGKLELDAHSFGTLIYKL